MPGQLTLVTSVTAYDFKDAATGRSIKGAKIAGVLPESAQDENRRGLRYFEMACTQDVYNKLGMAVPCLADVEFGMKGVGTKMGMSVVGAVIRDEKSITLRPLGFDTVPAKK